MQPQVARHVGPIERLRRVVEDVQDVVLGVVEQQLQRHKPIRREVLAFIDDQRMPAAADGLGRVGQGVRQRDVPPGLVGWLGLGRERVGLGAKSQAQLVEGRDRQHPGRDEGGQVGLVGDRARQRLVEADEERLVALRGELPCLLDRHERLAAAGAALDRGATLPPQDPQDVQLVLGRREERPLAGLDVAAKERPQLDRRLQDLPDRGAVRLGQWSVSGAVAGPVAEDAVQGLGRGGLVGEVRAVDDQLDRRVRPERVGPQGSAIGVAGRRPRGACVARGGRASGDRRRSRRPIACVPTIAWWNGLSGRGRLPANQRPDASRATGPSLTSIARIPYSGWTTSRSVSPSRGGPPGRVGVSQWTLA